MLVNSLANLIIVTRKCLYRIKNKGSVLFKRIQLWNYACAHIVYVVELRMSIRQHCNAIGSSILCRNRIQRQESNENAFPWYKINRKILLLLEKVNNLI